MLRTHVGQSIVDSLRGRRRTVFLELACSRCPLLSGSGGGAWEIREQTVTARSALEALFTGLESPYRRSKPAMLGAQMQYLADAQRQNLLVFPVLFAANITRLQHLTSPEKLFDDG